jgi:hypothetical protein
MNIKTLILLALMISLVFISGSCIILDQDGQQAETADGIDEGLQSEIEDEDQAGTDITDKENDASADDLSDLIIVDFPSPGQVIASPLDISGQARGTWFFEASFPVRLLDAEGNIIAEHYAMTDEEWMTEEFISFSSRLEFVAPETETGTLLLIKDNPSDIREYDAQLEIPVRFK